MCIFYTNFNNLPSFGETFRVVRNSSGVELSSVDLTLDDLFAIVDDFDVARAEIVSEVITSVLDCIFAFVAIC